LNLFLYKYIGSKLYAEIVKGYIKGQDAVIKHNKKNILGFSEPNPLFDRSYTGIDNEVLKNFQVEAFTVASVKSYELEEKLKALALEILSGKHKYLIDNPESDRYSLFQDEAYNILADYIPVQNMPSPSDLKTNLRTAATSAYHAAEWIKLQKLQDIYPAYMYCTRRDNRVREAHALLDGSVYYASDPVWLVIWPPNDWNCRCYIKPLSAEELKAINPEQIHSLDDASVDALLKRGIIAKDFQRNSGEAKSIWGKWIKQQFNIADYYKEFKNTFNYAYSVNAYQSKGLIDKILESNSIKLPEKELTPENWENEFPNNEVNTPFGKGKLVATREYLSQYEKMLLKEDGRANYFGAMKPTLEDPAIIIKDSKGALLFFRSFKTEGDDIIFMSVGYDKGNIINIASCHRRRIQKIMNGIKEDEVLHFSASALVAFAETPGKHSTVGGNLLNPDANIRKFSRKANDPNETWGFKNFTSGEIIITKIFFNLDGVTAIDGLTGDKSKAGYAELDSLRKGVFLYDGTRRKKSAVTAD
jgi:SPP1 gp7 family putative phage head morphogenesis protein